MRILIDVGHPAHVHLFRHFAVLSENAGDKVLFTFRDREPIKKLLEYYQLNSICFGPHYKTPLAKIAGLIRYDLEMLRACISFKPDIMLSHGSMYAAQVSRLISIPHISFEDTFNLEQIRLYLPFTDVVLTGMYDHRSLGSKEIRYPGYHELAYLHPEIFRPDEDVLRKIGVSPSDRYAVIRFVAWNASHDIGHSGMNIQNKIKLIKSLSKEIQVLVSSEDPLPEDLSRYGIKINPEKMHDLLYYAHVFVGESATMASECAVLGVPAVYINNAQLGYTNEQQRYGLVHSFTEESVQQEAAIETALTLATEVSVKNRLKPNLLALLDGKINVTRFLYWFVHEYPASVKEAKEPGFNFNRFA
jgi:predicted glycosyltransferase